MRNNHNFKLISTKQAFNYQTSPSDRIIKVWTAIANVIEWVRISSWCMRFERIAWRGYGNACVERIITGVFPRAVWTGALFTLMSWWNIESSGFLTAYVITSFVTKKAEIMFFVVREFISLHGSSVSGLLV